MAIRVLTSVLTTLLLLSLSLSDQGTAVSGPASAIERQVGGGHPFLLVTESEFQALRDRAGETPWSEMMDDAIATSDMPPDVSSGTNRDKANSLSDFMLASALAYILDPQRADVYAERVLAGITTYLDALDVDAGPSSGSWSATVPPANAVFSAIVSLDTVHDHLTASESAAAEDKIQSIVDLIAYDGSWELARIGMHGTWDIYRGVRTTPDDAYYQAAVKNLTDTGVFTGGAAYAHARYSANDRFVKSGYMDVLEHTGIDTRYYENPRFVTNLEWMYGSTTTPNGNIAVFGDTSIHSGMGRFSNSADHLGFRAVNFSEQAAAYFHLATQTLGLDRRGNLLTYAVPESDLPPAEPGASRIYPEAGAYLREASTSSDALMGALNNSVQSAGHAHMDVNALYVAGYGEHLLLNSGYAGWRSGALGYSWDYIHNTDYANNVLKTDDHRSKTGAGITEGFTTPTFDYAVGDAGPALPNDRHRRGLFMVHPQEDANGYFFTVDQVDGRPNVDVRTYLHPNSTSVETVQAGTAYTAGINGYLRSSANDDLGLDVLYGTEPDQVSIGTGVHAGWDRRIPGPDEPTSFEGDHLEAQYRTDAAGQAEILTMLFPSDDTHSAATMQRRSGPGFSGASVAHGGGVVDRVLVSTGHDVDDGSITFDGETAFYRSREGTVEQYFVMNGTSLRAGDVGFESSADVSVHLDGSTGKISSSGARVTFHSAGTQGVTLDGQGASTVAEGDGWLTVDVPPGTWTLGLSDAEEYDGPPRRLQFAMDDTSIRGGVYRHDTHGDETDLAIREGNTTDRRIPMNLTDDAYVRGGTYADRNFGADDRLVVKEGGANPSFRRRSLVTFDVSSLVNAGLDDVTREGLNVTLRVYGRNTEDGTHLILDALPVAPDWDEGSIRWTNAPGGGTEPVASVEVTEYEQYYELDVSDHVLSAVADGQESVSLVLRNTRGQNRTMVFDSKEGENTPQLVVTPASTKPTYLPTDDALVRGGAFADQNYGDDSSLVVRSGTPNPKYHRRSYITFDAADWAGQGGSEIAAATLRIYGLNAQDGTDMALGAYAVPDTGWDEGTITWDNAPQLGDHLDTVVVGGVSKYHEIDVTDYVRSQPAGTSKVSFALHDPWSEDRALVFESKERFRPPQLVLTPADPGEPSSAERFVLESFENRAFVRFDVSEISHPIRQATIRVNARSNGSEDGQLGAFAVTDDDWSGTTTTWANAPDAESTALDTADVAPDGQYVELDVTDFVRDERSGDGVVSLGLRDPHRSGNAMIVSGSQTLQAPYLDIEVDVTPESLVGLVEQHHGSGTPSEAWADRLGSTVRRAERHLRAGRHQAAVTHLEVFTRRLEIGKSRGWVSQAGYGSLAWAANVLIDEWTTG